MLPEASSDKDYTNEITRLNNDRKSNQRIFNVHPTCDADITATEAIKVFKK